MRILFLCNKSPWPPKEGGPIAMNMLIEGLLEKGHEVKVLAVNSYKYKVDLSVIPADYREKTGIELITLDLRPRLIPAFLNLFTSRSYHVERFISEKFSKRLEEILKENVFDIVQLETLVMAAYIDVIRRHSRSKIVLRAHNIEHLIWKRVAENTSDPLKRMYLNHLSSTLKIFEDKSLLSVDGIAAITGNDAEYFSSITGVPVLPVPFGINLRDYHPPGKISDQPTIFIIGAMNWIPNQEGLKWFLREVWDDLHRRFPELKFRIAGREMPSWMTNLSLENVVVEGEVENASDFFISNDIMIVPLFSGSGIRIKVIEAMAYGKTVISTGIGTEGIDCTNGENVLTANLSCEFFEMISVCLENPELILKIGKQARQLVEDHYDRDKIIGSLEGFYQQITL